MKKKLLLILLVAIIPFLTNAASCNDSVTVKSISMDSGSYEEMERATIEGDKINVSAHLKSIDDYVQYKITLKNTSNKKYTIECLNNDENLKYELTTNDNSLLLSPNSEKDVLLKISYKEKVDDSLFENEKYSKDTNISLNIIQEETPIINPDTLAYFPILIIVLLLISVAVIWLAIKNKKAQNVASVIILMITVIPFIVYAEACKKEIKINLNAQFVKTYNIAYLVEVSQSLPAYFTNAELNDPMIDFSGANCTGTPTYIGEVSEENKYSACMGSILYYDTESYTKDQLVPLKLIDLRDISSFDSNYDIVCSDEGSYRLCQDTAKIDYNTKNVWQYSKTVIDSQEGYSYNDNDLDYMNFTNGTYSNFWTESGYFTVKTPNNFTMPNHNIFFKSY